MVAHGLSPNLRPLPRPVWFPSCSLRLSLLLAALALSAPAARSADLIVTNATDLVNGDTTNPGTLLSKPGTLVHGLKPAEFPQFKGSRLPPNERNAELAGTP